MASSGPWGSACRWFSRRQLPSLVETGGTIAFLLLSPCLPSPAPPHVSPFHFSPPPPTLLTDASLDFRSLIAHRPAGPVPVGPARDPVREALSQTPSQGLLRVAAARCLCQHVPPAVSLGSVAPRGSLLRGSACGPPRIPPGQGGSPEAVGCSCRAPCHCSRLCCPYCRFSRPPLGEGPAVSPGRPVAIPFLRTVRGLRHEG